MARYNTTLSSTTVSSASSLTAPQQGLFTEFTGTAPYTVVIPDPTVYNGQTQIFYNSTVGTITLSTPNGLFGGPGGSGTTSQTLVSGATLILSSDGSNYVQTASYGGPMLGTTLTATSTVSLNPANAAVSIAPTGTGTLTLGGNSSGNVTISPSGSGTLVVAPSTTGTIDNMNIGATTPGTLKATTGVIGKINVNLTANQIGANNIVAGTSGTITIYQPASAIRLIGAVNGAFLATNYWLNA